MPSPRNESTNRNWWPLSKGTSSKEQQQSFSIDKNSRDVPRKRIDSHKFNTLATAIGFKSKKHPSLAIQDPPSPILPFIPVPESSYRPEGSPKYTSRPPSKSVSSTRSRVDSIEPRTPSDGQRDSATNRHSLLTLSDMDPFAARGIAVPPAAVDPNRLSAYSNSSVGDYVSKRVEEQPKVNRGSYASSSSHSYPDEVTLVSPTSLLHEQLLTDPASQKKLANSLLQRNSHLAPEDSWHSLSTMVKSHSSSTLTDKNRLSQPEPVVSPRPPMRARGLTDVGSSTQHSKFLLDEHSPSKPTTPTKPSSSPVSPMFSSVSPRVVVRQPSIQRMGLPVSAPPSQRLPPPPVTLDMSDDDGDPSMPEFNASASSSSLSFKSSRDTGITNQHYIPRSKTRERTLISSQSAVGSSPDVGSSIKSHNPPRTLKKAVSHQSLTKGASPSSSSIIFPPEATPERAPRKQRSFHHPRIPLPPIPNPLRHQGTSSSFISHDNGSSTEPKRGSVGSHPTQGRTRLFSGSSMRRTSTSHDRTGEDDARSVFSLPLDRERKLNNSLKNLHMNSGGTTASSFWDESGSDHPPSSPHASSSTADYTPQQIMSPAEMLKLEASVQESFSFSRARGMSIISSSTFNSESDYSQSSTGLTTTTQDLINNSQHLMRSTSMMDKSGGVVPPRLPRPSTAQGSMSSPMRTGNAQSSSFVGLQPPPRSRRPPTSPITSPPSDSPRLIPLSPPPRKGIHKQNLAEMGLHRASIMRKPSFLDIEDEGDKGAKSLHREGSFLDLARESLDTVRSDTDDERS